MRINYVCQSVEINKVCIDILIFCVNNIDVSKSMYDIIKKQTQEIIKRHKGILITFWGIVGLGILIFLATFILSYFVGDKEISNEIIKWLDENSKAIKVISGSGSALFTVIGIILGLTNETKSE